MITQNLWDAAKAVLRGKFIAIQSYLKKQEKHRIDNLSLHLKQLEKEEQKKPQNQQKERNHKDLSTNHEKEMKETILKINKTKSWFFEKINKIDKPLAKLIKKKRENQINKITNEKKRRYNRQCRNTKNQTIMNNYMAIKNITWKKWIDSLKCSSFQY